jgi:hypothetical protein
VLSQPGAYIVYNRRPYNEENAVALDHHTTNMDKPPDDKQQDRLHARLRQLILMRETGPKRAAWHEVRMRLIWRLHDRLRQATAGVEAEQPESETPPGVD